MGMMCLVMSSENFQLSQQFFSFWMGGQTASPKEQKTQQSSLIGFKSILQLKHS